MPKRIEIAENVAEKLKSDKIRLIILFGSVARGDDHEHSDIDLLIVSDYHDDIWPKIKTLIRDAIMSYGELLSVHVMPEDVFNQTRNQSFLTNVFNDGKILYENRN